MGSTPIASGSYQKFWLLKKHVTSRVFQNLTVPQIACLVLAAGGVPHRFSLTRSYAVREYSVQYQESDYVFVRRILAEEGIFFYFTPPGEGELDGVAPPGGVVAGAAMGGAVGGAMGGAVGAAIGALVDGLVSHNLGLQGPGEAMIFIDAPTAYPAMLGGDLVHLRAPGNAIPGGGVDVFHLKNSFGPSSVLLRDYDFTRPLLELRANAGANGTRSTALDAAAQVANAVAGATDSAAAGPSLHARRRRVGGALVVGIVSRDDGTAHSVVALALLRGRARFTDGTAVGVAADAVRAESAHAIGRERAALSVRMVGLADAALAVVRRRAVRVARARRADEVVAVPALTVGGGCARLRVRAGRAIHSAAVQVRLGAILGAVQTADRDAEVAPFRIADERRDAILVVVACDARPGLRARGHAAHRAAVARARPCDGRVHVRPARARVCSAFVHVTRRVGVVGRDLRTARAIASLRGAVAVDLPGCGGRTLRHVLQCARAHRTGRGHALVR